MLVEAECFEDCISRAYYAAFHAAKAVLLHRGIQTESHSGTKALFGLHMVDGGVLDRRYARILDSLMSRRESSDYDVWNVFDRDDASAALKEAEELVVAVEQVLRREGVPL